MKSGKGRSFSICFLKGSTCLSRLGAPEELRSLASDVAPTLYLAEPEILAEFRQDVPWIPTDFMESKDARLFRRFDGCRFLVAFPCSTPIAEMTPPFVVLDGLNSASNVGQVLRTAYHLGINSVIASPGAWSCLNGRACRVSMGWFYRMSFHVARPLSKAIDELKQLGVCLYVAENQFSQPVAPHQPHGDRRWALVIGSEFSGVSQEIVHACDQRVCVPQQQGHSLNVAHACSICLYELSKFNVMDLDKTSASQTGAFNQHRMHDNNKLETTQSTGNFSFMEQRNSWSVQYGVTKHPLCAVWTLVASCSILQDSYPTQGVELEICM